MQLALAGIKAVKESLRRAYANGDDIEARSGMAFAALTSGICLANAGLGAVHGIAGTTGAMFNIPHGVVCGTLMASANEVTVREAQERSQRKRGVAQVFNSWQNSLREGARHRRIFSGCIHTISPRSDRKS